MMRTNGQRWRVGASIAFLLMLVGSAPMIGCSEGPFEEAGEELDDAADEVEDELD